MSDDLRIVDEAARVNSGTVAARAVEDPDYAREVNALFHPELEFRSRVVAVEGRIYRGHDGIGRYWADMLDAFADWGFVRLDWRALGPGRMLAIGEFEVRGRQSGAPVRFPHASIWEVEDGLVRRIETFSSEDEARAAAGS